jgi:prepilin-type processing-associated H-X9-DG protein
VELLVVISVIAVLIALLLPALSGARKAAQTLKCASNVRQICTALLGYSSENRGRFPPNLASQMAYWYDQDRAGQWLASNVSGTAGGGPMICPEDDFSWRSYSMNHWASSKVDASALLVRQVWSPAAVDSSRVILITESWSTSGSAVIGWSAQPTVGKRGNDAGLMFGAKGGLSPFSAGRWGVVNSELTYNRHRLGKGTGTQPIGRLNIGYADGHVETVSSDDLADQSTGLSALTTLWSPLDYQYP